MLKLETPIALHLPAPGRVAVTLLNPASALMGASIGKERGCKQNSSTGSRQWLHLPSRQCTLGRKKWGGGYQRNGTITPRGLHLPASSASSIARQVSPRSAGRLAASCPSSA